MKILKKALAAIGFILILSLVVFVVVVNTPFEAGVNSVLVQQTTVSKDRIKVDCLSAASGERFRSYKYRVDGEKVFITVYSSYVNSFSPGGGRLLVDIEDDFKDIKQVYLEDTYAEKLIYPAKQRGPILDIN